MKLYSSLLIAVASATIAFGANVYQVQSGEWNSNIWSNVYNGSVVPALRPGASDAASLSAGSVTMSAGTYTIASLLVNTAVTGANMTIASDATLSATSVNYTGVQSNLNILGTLTVANTFVWGRNNSFLTLSGTLYSGSTMTLGATATTVSVTGVLTANGTLYSGGPRSLVSVGTGGIMNANTSFELRNNIATFNTFAIGGGTLNAYAFRGSSLTASSEIATITVTSGVLNNTGTVAQLIGATVSNVGVVVMNQSGGTVSFNQGGGIFNLTGTASAIGVVGAYNLSGGTLVLNGGVAYGSGGKYRADAGSVHSNSVSTTISTYNGYTGGVLNFTGGRIITEMLAIDLVNDGGLLRVGLSDTQAATLTSGTFSGFTYTQKSTGGLELDMLGNTVFDKVNYQNNAIVLENATSFYITLAEGYTPTGGTIFSSVMEADSITGDASTFQIYVDGVLSAWTAEIVGGNALNLTASYIPEPAVAGILVGVLALAAAARRRR